ncbi:MAG: CoA-disulfide reductase [Peptoniphilaceae bacterium]
MKVLIIGGVAGGATAAARLRRLDEDLEIIMFEKGEYISYANCGLPYYIGNVIKEKEKLLVQTVEEMKEKFNLDIRNFSEVTKINPKEKTLEVKNLKIGQVYEESYDKLLIATGASPVKPPLKGLDQADDLFTLRTVENTEELKNFALKDQVKEVAIIGGGLIGVEMAENLHNLGKDITIIEGSDQIMGPIDPDMARIAQEHLENKNVKIILSDIVEKIEEKGRKIITKSGKEIKTDMIILSIGISPESSLAKEAGLDLGEKGHIKVNKKLQTSDENIYAVGDVIEFKDAILGETMSLALAGPANRCARIAANNICSIDDEYTGFFGTSIVKVFDLQVASTGMNEKRLKDLGIDYRTVHTHPLSNAGYYPDSIMMSFKLLFENKTGKILGAQAIGGKGVDKRIDVIATALYGKMTVRDLTQLELAYAPPYGGAKDVINLVGYAAENILDGLVETISSEELDQILEKGGKLINIYDKSEEELEGAINMPIGQIREKTEELSDDKTYVIYQIGVRSYLAGRVMSSMGKDVKSLDSGYKIYMDKENMLEKDRQVIKQAEKAKNA